MHARGIEPPRATLRAAAATVHARFRAILECVAAGWCGALATGVAPAVGAIRVRGARFCVRALGRASATAIDVGLGPVLHVVRAGRVRADACGAAADDTPGFETICVHFAALAVAAGCSARAAVRPTAVQVRFLLILDAITAGGCGTGIVRSANSVNTVARRRASLARAASSTSERAAAINTAFTLILYSVRASRHGAAQCPRAVVYTTITRAIGGDGALHSIGALLTRAAAAVRVGFGAVSDSVVTLRLGADPIDAIDVRYRQVAIRLHLASLTLLTTRAASPQSVNVSEPFLMPSVQLAAAQVV